MFIDKLMAIGFSIAAAGVGFAALAVVLVLAYYEPSPAPQVVRLVALVPSPGDVILNDVGDSAPLTVQGYYSDLTTEDLDEDFITYKSTDPSVISVSPDGVVTANDSGGADIIIRFGGFSKRVHALVFGDLPTLPPIDPAMVGPIPGLDEEVRAVLNRVMVELQPGYDAEDIASELGGEVVFSYHAFPGHVIEFDTQQRDLMAALTQLGADGRIKAVSPDFLFEALDHPIDTLSLDNDNPVAERPTRAYYNAGFEGAWRMMERVPVLNPVVISVVEPGVLNITAQNQHPIISKEFELERVHTPLTSATTSGHAASVASVMVAANHRLPSNASHPELDIGNFSGIVTSVEDLHYDLISLNTDQFLSLSDTLRQLETVSVIQQDGTIEIDVVNMSFGAELAWGKNLASIPVLNQWKPGAKIKNIIKNTPNVTFVPAAGNCEVEATGFLPAALSVEPDVSNVITVGGANASYTSRWTTHPPKCVIETWLPLVDEISTDVSLPLLGVRNGNSSAYGEAITIAAPATGVLVAGVDDDGSGGYYWSGGTSHAAPMVSGTVALLKAIDPDLTPTEIKALLRETGDEKTICTSTPTPPDACPSDDEEDWKFLRADKAIAKALSDRVGAEIEDRVTVPVETQRVVGRNYDFGLYIANTGEMVWPFYVEAFLRDPSGVERGVPYVAENAVAPRRSHPFRWQFWPSANASGCWGLRVKVWMEDPEGDSTPLIDALKELYPNASDQGLLADSGWIEGALEVRQLADQPVSCSGADNMVPLPLPSAGGEDDSPNMAPQAGVKANVLLLADTSGSMEGPKVAALKEAIDIFANRMYEIRFQTKGGIDPDPDHVGLVDFDNGYYEVLPIGPIDPAGTGLDAWQDAVDSLDADGGTALYDAIVRAVGVLEGESPPGRPKVLIALTDGVDQDSGSSFSDTLDKLSESSVTLFALALSEPGGSGDYDFDVLEELANASRGAAYAANTTNLSGLYELFSTIFEIEP